MHNNIIRICCIFLIVRYTYNSRSINRYFFKCSTIPQIPTIFPLFNFFLTVFTVNSFSLYCGFFTVASPIAINDCPFSTIFTGFTLITFDTSNSSRRTVTHCHSKTIGSRSYWFYKSTITNLLLKVCDSCFNTVQFLINLVNVIIIVFTRHKCSRWRNHQGSEQDCT